MKNQAGPVPNSLYEHDHLVLFVQTPFDSASTGNEEENKAVESGQLAFVQRRKEIRSHLELPVELEISHGHLAAAEESYYARLKTQHHRQPSKEFDDSAEPELGPHRWLKLGKHPQDFLGAVEREHESRHNSHQGVSVVSVLFKPFHECTLQLRDFTAPAKP